MMGVSLDIDMYYRMPQGSGKSKVWGEVIVCARENPYIEFHQHDMKTCCFLLVIVSILSCGDSSENSAPESNVSAERYRANGDSLVKITFDTLRNTLSAAIAAGGPGGAVQLCNTEAGRITGIYSGEGISIGRVSDRPRNPGNRLSELDRKSFETYVAQVASKDSLRSIVIQADGKFHYYKPIIVQQMCLVCHGAPGKDLSAGLINTIDSLYPADQAKGYKAGDLRGMWHIVFSETGIPGK